MRIKTFFVQKYGSNALLKIFYSHLEKVLKNDDGAGNK
jgi:hypothetical protein